TGGTRARLHRAGLHAEGQRVTFVDLELAVDARLLDVGDLVVVRDAQDLRSQARGPEVVVAVAAGAGVGLQLRGEQRAAGDRQPVVELEGLGPVVRRVAARCGRGRIGGIGRVGLEAGAGHLAREAERGLAAAGDRVVRQAARLGVVVVDAEVEVLGDVPVDV